MIYINEVLVDESRRSTPIEGAVLYKELKDVPYWEDSVEFVFGSISDAVFLNRNQMSRKTNYWDLTVREFMASLGELCFNFDGVFKLSCQLGKDDVWKFCRSDSGAKTWPGQVFADEALVKLAMTRTQCDDLMFLASAKRIWCEARFWVSWGKVVAESPYHEERLKHEIDEFEMEWMRTFVETYVVPRYDPDERFVVDMCVDEDDKGSRTVKVVECNCWGTSGFYDADIESIVKHTIKGVL